MKDETVWLTQKALAELFGVQRPAVTKHRLNIFNTGELGGELSMFHLGAYGRRWEDLTLACKEIDGDRIVT